MSVQSSQLEAERLAPGGIQFGLSEMMALTAAVAVTCTLLFSMPNELATPALILITLALPCVFTTVIVYGRGYRRTFSIGAMFPAGTMLVCTTLMLLIHSISAYQNSVDEWKTFVDKVGPYYRPYVAVAWILSVLFGLLSIIVRILVERVLSRQRTDSVALRRRIAPRLLWRDLDGRGGDHSEETATSAETIKASLGLGSKNE